MTEHELTRTNDWIDQALGVVMVAEPGCSAQGIVRAAAWALDCGQPLTVVELRPAAALFRALPADDDTVGLGIALARARYPRLVLHRRLATGPAEPMIAWLSRRASSLVVDAGIAAEAPEPPALAPRCPVLVLPAAPGPLAPDAPVLLAVGGCEGCAVPMGYAFAHADRIGAPLRVVVLAEDDGLDQVEDRLAMFAACYPQVSVTVARTDAGSLASHAAGARLVVTGVAHPGSRPSPEELRSLAAGPIALVPLAA